LKRNDLKLIQDDTIKENPTELAECTGRG